MKFMQNVARLVKGHSPFGIGIFVALALFPLLNDNFFYLEIVRLSVIYGIFAMSWDILTGYTHEVNFGFAFFIGGAGYVSAILNAFFALSPYMAIPLGGLAAGVTGIFIGYLTLRLKGPYFSMLTLAFSSILFKLSFIFYNITGGEEGISGLDTLTDGLLGDYFVVLGTTLAIYLFLTAYAGSKHGIILKAIRADVDATQSAGINTSYYKIEAFAISGFLAGIGGGLFAHSQMSIGPTMLAGDLSTLVVLLAMIGGMGSVVGPFLSGLFLWILNEALRVVEIYRIVIFTGALMVFIYLAPNGLVNLKWVRNSKLLSFILLGERKTQ